MFESWRIIRRPFGCSLSFSFGCWVFVFCFINILASTFSLQCIILCSIASFLYIHLLHCSDVNVWNLSEFSSSVLQQYSHYLPYFISCYDRLNIVVHLTVGLRWLFLFYDLKLYALLFDVLLNNWDMNNVVLYRYGKKVLFMLILSLTFVFNI